MARQQWEYLFVMYQHAVTQNADSGAREYQSDYQIWRPGEMVEVPNASWLEILNALGSGGWELIDSDNVQSTVVGPQFGYAEVSMPLRTRYTFKRPKIDAA